MDEVQGKREIGLRRTEIWEGKQNIWVKIGIFDFFPLVNYVDAWNNSSWNKNSSANNEKFLSASNKKWGEVIGSLKRENEWNSLVNGSY